MVSERMPFLAIDILMKINKIGSVLALSTLALFSTLGTQSFTTPNASGFDEGEATKLAYFVLIDEGETDDPQQVLSVSLPDENDIDATADYAIVLPDISLGVYGLDGHNELGKIGLTISSGLSYSIISEIEITQKPDNIISSQWGKGNYFVDDGMSLKSGEFVDEDAGSGSGTVEGGIFFISGDKLVDLYDEFGLTKGVSGFIRGYSTSGRIADGFDFGYADDYQSSQNLGGLYVFDGTRSSESNNGGWWDALVSYHENNHWLYWVEGTLGVILIGVLGYAIFAENRKK